MDRMYFVSRRWRPGHSRLFVSSSDTSTMLPNGWFPVEGFGPVVHRLTAYCWYNKTRESDKKKNGINKYTSSKHGSHCSAVSTTRHFLVFLMFFPVKKRKSEWLLRRAKSCHRQSLSGLYNIYIYIGSNHAIWLLMLSIRHRLKRETVLRFLCLQECIIPSLVAFFKTVGECESR